MTKITLNENAVEIIEKAILENRVIQRDWCIGDSSCLLGLLATKQFDTGDLYKDVTLPLGYIYCLKMGLSRFAIDRITYEFDNLRIDQIPDYARRFAKVAENQVDYNLACKQSIWAELSIISVLERHLTDNKIQETVKE